LSTDCGGGRDEQEEGRGDHGQRSMMAGREEMALYPINLRIRGRLVVVVGGGEVALRKVKGLLAAEARIRLVCPHLEGQLLEFSDSGCIDWVPRGYAEGDLKGAFMAFAATDDRQVQGRIEREAVRQGILLNSADDPTGCDFHIPAHFRRGRMLITVSTGGGSPALAKMVRERLEREIAPHYGAVVELMARIRECLVDDDGRGDDSAANGEIFRRLLQQGLVELVLADNWFDVQMLLLRELPASVDAVALVRRFLEQHDTAA
jgi:precorrin-2 dehydrogenase / sirohydrochlorin ferrochelatase